MTEPDDLREKLKFLTDHVMAQQRDQGCACDPVIGFDVAGDDDEADLVAAVYHKPFCPRNRALDVN